MVNFIANAFLTIFQFILRVFKKAACCLRRRRRLSCDPVPLTNIGVVPNVQKDGDMQMWNAWEESEEKSPIIVTSGKPLDPVQQQIEMYRQQRMALSQNDNNQEPKIDYFEDMAPRIVKQTKMFLQTRENEENKNSNIFSLAPDPAFNSSELGIWEDSQTWEDQTERDWDANNLIREKKKVDREERLARQQKKKLERKSKILWTSAPQKKNVNSFNEEEKEFVPN